MTENQTTRGTLPCHDASGVVGSSCELPMSAHASPGVNMDPPAPPAFKKQRLSLLQALGARVTCSVADQATISEPHRQGSTAGFQAEKCVTKEVQASVQRPGSNVVPQAEQLGALLDIITAAGRAHESSGKSCGGVHPGLQQAAAAEKCIKLQLTVDIVVQPMERASVDGMQLQAEQAQLSEQLVVGAPDKPAVQQAAGFTQHEHLQEEHELLLTAYKQLQAQCAAAEAAAGKSQQQTTTLLLEHQQLQEQHQKLQAESAEVRQQHVQLKVQNEQLLLERAKQAEAYAGIHRALLQSMEQHQSTQEKYTNLCVEIAHVQEQCKSAMAGAATACAMRQLGTLKLDHQQLQQRHSQLQNSYAELNRQIEQLQAEHTELLLKQAQPQAAQTGTTSMLERDTQQAITQDAQPQPGAVEQQQQGVEVPAAAVETGMSEQHMALVLAFQQLKAEHLQLQTDYEKLQQRAPACPSESLAAKRARALAAVLDEQAAAEELALAGQCAATGQHALADQQVPAGEQAPFAVIGGHAPPADSVMQDSACSVPDELQQLRQQLATAQQQLELQSAGMAHTRELLDAEYHRLRTANGVYRAENHRLRQQLQQLSTLTERAEAAKAQAAEEVQQANQAKEEAQRLQAGLMHSQQSWVDERNWLQSMHVAAVKNSEALQSQLPAARNMGSGDTGKCAALQAQCEELQKQLDQCKEDHQQKYKQLQKEAEQLNQQHQQLLQDHEMLQLQIAEMVAGSKTRNTLLDKARETVSSLIAKQAAEEKQRQVEKAAAQAAYETAQTTLQKQSQQIACLQHELGTLLDAGLSNSCWDMIPPLGTFPSPLPGPLPLPARPRSRYV